MDLLAALVLGVFSSLPPVQVPTAGSTAGVWMETWNDLARFGEAAPGSAEHDRLWRDLDGFQVRHERAARKSHDRVEAFRAHVLRVHLSRLSGVVMRPLLEPGSNIEFLPGEAWLALQVVGPGPTRAKALRGALAEVKGEVLRTRSDRGIQIAEEDARDLHLDVALDEARSLHGCAPDARTARLLGRVLRLRGEYDEAAKTLQDAIEGSQGLADRSALLAALLAERAELRVASGAYEAAITDLGAALASGSKEAGLQLALRALSEGLPARARALFRSLLEGDSIPPAALRGYGCALLSCVGPPWSDPRNP